jgi:hypothetical protein
MDGVYKITRALCIKKSLLGVFAENECAIPTVAGVGTSVSCIYQTTIVISFSNQDLCINYIIVA